MKWRDQSTGKLTRTAQMVSISAGAVTILASLVGGAVAYDNSVDARIKQEVQIVEQKTGAILDERYCTDLGEKIRFLENKEEFGELKQWEKTELRRIRSLFQRKCGGDS